MLIPLCCLPAIVADSQFPVWGRWLAGWRWTTYISRRNCCLKEKLHREDADAIIKKNTVSPHWFIPSKLFFNIILSCHQPWTLLCQLNKQKMHTTVPFLNNLCRFKGKAALEEQTNLDAHCCPQQISAFEKKSADSKGLFPFTCYIKHTDWMRRNTRLD